MPPRGRKSVKDQKSKSSASKGLTFGGKIKPKAIPRTPSPTPVTPQPEESGLGVPILNSISRFNLTDLSAVTHKQPRDDKLRITWPKKTFFDLREYSTKGVMLGTKNSTIYVKVDGTYGGDSSSPYDLQHCLSDIDAYAREAYEATAEQLVKMWGEIDEVKYLGGSSELKESDKLLGKINYCFFPHQTYTSVYEYDSRKGTQPSKKKIEHLFSRSGNSEFIFRLSVNCVEFVYDNKVVTVQPYVNVTTMTWIDEGQDTQVTDEMEEQTRVAQQISNITSILKASSSSSRVVPSTSSK